jgi:hypothetical protein
MQKHVISVGFDIPGEVNECVDFTSDTSLLDADIIVFSPNIRWLWAGRRLTSRFRVFAGEARHTA